MIMLAVAFLLGLILCLLFGVPYIDFLKKKILIQQRDGDKKEEYTALETMMKDEKSLLETLVLYTSICGLKIISVNF